MTHLPSKDRGFALLMTLVVVLILTSLVADLSYSSRVSAAVAANHRDRLKAFYLAKSGVEISMLRLKLDKMVDSTLGKKDNMTELQWSMPFSYPLGLSLLAGSLGDEEVPQEATDAFLKKYDAGGTFDSVISDERSRININAIKVTGNNPNGSYFLLLNLLSLPTFKRYFKDSKPIEKVDAVVDWLDADKEARGVRSGLEDIYYQGLEKPYHAKNGPMFSIDELRLVQDMEIDLFEELKPLLTIYPFSTQVVTVKDYGKININTAPKLVIAALFNQGYVSNVEDVAKQVIELRDKVPFASVKVFLETLQNSFGIDLEQGIIKDIQGMLAISSDTFRVDSEGTVNKSTVKVQAIVDRSGNEPEFFLWQVN
jgi:general secretion pathway protein K